MFLAGGWRAPHPLFFPDFPIDESIDMNDVVLITPPAAEPVSLDEMMQMLGMGSVIDDTLAGVVATQLNGYLLAARQDCENYCRRVFITQTWLMKCDGWPHRDMSYDWDGYRAIMLPKPPFQSIEFFRYVDFTGALLDLPLDDTYGNGSEQGQYRYRLIPGSETQPARVLPAWLTPWPLVRQIPANVLLQFKAGYGGPALVSMTSGSSVLVGPKFNPGDVGQMVSVPGAGVNGVALITGIASVDGNGQATLSATASTAIANVQAWIGQPVPEVIRQAIKFQAQFYYEQGAVLDMEMPRVVRSLLDPYRNLVA